MRITVGALALMIAGAAPILAQRQVIHGPGEVQGLPFSSAVRIGSVLYLSGQIGNVPGTRQLADTGVGGQTRQALENIKRPCWRMPVARWSVWRSARCSSPISATTRR